MNQRNSSIIKISASMLIFGTIGLFVRLIPLSSGLIALTRGIIGAAFLLIVMLLSKKNLDYRSVKENLVWLLLSGCAIGFNWILLFESYRFTSVAVSTLCYYTAPVFVILASPLLFHDKLTIKNVCCVIASLIGMFFVSGILQTNFTKSNELTGIICGVGAALLYASVMLMNQKILGMNAYDKTVVQLGVSALVLLPYCLFTVDFSDIHLDTLAVVMLIVVGVVHTGFAYFLYFGAMSHVKAHTVAVLSYIDPVIAVLVSGLILKEQIGIETVIGAVLILGSSVISELPIKRRKS